MAFTVQLTDQEHEDLRRRAAIEGISTHDAARKAVREFVARSDHRDRVDAAAEMLSERHSDALRRLRN